MANILKALEKNRLTGGFADGKHATMGEEKIDKTEKELEFLGALRAHMKARGITQVAVAEKMGLARGHMSQMMAGIRPIRIGQLLQILDITGYVPPDMRSGRSVEDLIDMNAVQNQEIFTEILRKLYRLDRAGLTPLQRANSYLDGLLDLAIETQKKNQNDKKI